MRIGILTFHAAGNYGAFLQAFSMQSVLNRLDNVEARIIDYVCSSIEDNYLPEKYLKKKGNVLKRCLLYCLRASQMKKQNSMFAEARKRHFLYDAKRLIKNDFDKLSYDFFIVGSDQVWNEELTNGDRVYYLDFIKDSRKKISYAISLGSDSGFPFSGEVLELIRDFSFISIREKKSAKIISSLFPDKEIYCCIDPVFLILPDVWRHFSKPVKGVENYLIIFAMGNGKTSNPMVSFAKAYAKEHSYNLLFLSDQEKWYKHRDIKHLVDITPEQFVWLIANAKAVVTNSFHATAFSIILNKQFFVETNIKRNGRIYDLLERFDLGQQALRNGKPVQKDTSPIIWDRVNERIEAERKSGLDYLNTALHKN